MTKLSRRAGAIDRWNEREDPMPRSACPVWLGLANLDAVFLERRAGNADDTSRLRIVAGWRVTRFRKLAAARGCVLEEVTQSGRMAPVRNALRTICLGLWARADERPRRSDVARAQSALWDESRDLFDLRVHPMIGSSGLDWLNTPSTRRGRGPWGLFAPRSDLDEVEGWLAAAVSQFYVDALFLIQNRSERSRLRVCELEGCGRVFVATRMTRRGKRLTDPLHPRNPDDFTGAEDENRFCLPRCRTAAHRARTRRQANASHPRRR